MDKKDKKPVSSWVRGIFEPKQKRNKAPKAKSNDIKTTSLSPTNDSVSIDMLSDSRADARPNAPANDQTQIGPHPTSVELADKVKRDSQLIRTMETEDAGQEGKHLNGIC